MRRLVSAERAVAQAQQQQAPKASGKGGEEVGRLKARHARLLAELEVGVGVIVCVVGWGVWCVDI